MLARDSSIAVMHAAVYSNEAAKRSCAWDKILGSSMLWSLIPSINRLACKEYQHKR